MLGVILSPLDMQSRSESSIRADLLKYECSNIVNGDDYSMIPIGDRMTLPPTNKIL